MDRLKLVPLERAELEDHLALQSLVYEHIKRHTGQLLGGGVLSSAPGGLLSSPSHNVSSSGSLTVKSFSFVGLSLGGDTSDGTTRTPEAHVSRFDPASDGHLNYPLDLSGATTGSEYCIYVRPVYVDSDQEARRQFSLVTAVEEPVTLHTRERERVEWSVLKSPTVPSGTRWVKIFSFTVSSSGVYTLTPLSLWDDANTKALTRISSPTIPEIMINTRELIDNTSRDNSHTLGIVEQLALIRAQLSRIIHAGAAYSSTIPDDTSKRWTDSPAKSLASLSTTQAAQQNSINYCVLSLNTLAQSNQVHRLYFRYELTWSATTSTFYHRSYDDLGCIVTLDAGTISGTTGIGAGGITSSDFERIIRRPVIGLPVNSSGSKVWEVLSYNVAPILRDNDVTPHDSLTDTATADRQPIPFNFALTSSYPIGEVPLSSEPKPPRTLPRIMTITNHTNPPATTIIDKALAFVLRFDPILVSGEFHITYDIQILVREVDA